MPFVKTLLCLIVNLCFLKASSQPVVFTAPASDQHAGMQSYMAGIYFMRKKDYHKARAAFDSAEKQLPDPLKLYYLRGIAYSRQDMHREAIGDFYRDHLLVPGRASYKTAQSFAAMGAVSSSLKWLDTARYYKIRYSRKSILDDPCFRKIRSHRKLRKKLRHYTFFLTERYVRLAGKRMREKEYAGALEYLDKALVIQPGIPEWLQMKAGIYRQLHEYSRERECYFEEASFQPFDKAEVYEDIAFSYFAQGDPHNTVIWLHQTIMEDSSFIARQLDIAEIYIASGEISKATAILDEYLQNVPMDHYACFLMALLQTDPHQTRLLAETAIELSREQDDKVPDEYMRLFTGLKSEE